MSAARVAIATPIATTIAAVVCACSSGAGDDAGKRKRPAIPVVTAPVELRSVPVTLSAVGTVESIATVALQPRVDGQIAKVFVRDGQEVKAGQPLLQLDQAPFEIQLRLARATLARDAAILENAHAKLEHGRALIWQKFISDDELTQLSTDYDSAKATTDADRAALDNAQLQLGYATIVAPVSGKLSHIAQQVGNTVHTSGSAPITTLDVLDTVDVSFSIPAQELGRLNSALHASAPQVQIRHTVDAAPEAVMTGKLSFFDNAADPSTGTIRLRARFDNRRRSLWPGEFVSVELVLQVGTSVPTVPAAAIAEGPNGTYVYVIRNGAIAEQRTVRVERTTATLAAVDGVRDGEQVVIDGQSRLSPNSPVTITPARPAP
jgi:multidrug efflux system membrane fusion protein